MTKWLALLLFVATNAFAYIPPSEFIIKNIVNKRSATLKSVRVKTHLEAMLGPAGAEKPAGARLTVTTYYSAVQDSLRAIVSDDSGKALYVMDRSGGLPMIDTVLFSPKTETVIETLRAKGIPIRTDDELAQMKDEPERRAAEVEFLARWKNTYAWVIGRRMPPTDHTEAQFWVEKDSFSPLRLLVPGAESGTWLDARFEAQRYTRGFAFPKAASVADNDGAIILHETLSDLVTNPTPSKTDEYYTLPRGYTEAGNIASSDVRALIQRYFETLR